MIHLGVDRRVGRQLLMMLVGVVLVLAAIDVMWVHRCDESSSAAKSFRCVSWALSGPPETNDDGALTSRGHAQRRQDILWSSVFLVTGGGAIFFAAVGLSRRRDVFELTDGGIRARVLSTTGYLEVPWSAIAEIRSSVDDSGSEIDDPLLVVTVDDSMAYPHNLWGAEWRGNELRINAGSWATPVEDVVVRASLLAARHDVARHESGGDDAAESVVVEGPVVEGPVVEGSVVREGGAAEDRG